MGKRFDTNLCQYSYLFIKNVFELIDCNYGIESLVQSDFFYFLSLSLIGLLIRLMLHVGRFDEINGLLLSKRSIRVVVWLNSFSFSSLLSSHLLAASYSRTKKFSELLTFLYVVKFDPKVNLQLSEFSVFYHQNLFFSNASIFLICLGHFQKRLFSDRERICLPVALYIPSSLSKCCCKKDIELH